MSTTPENFAPSMGGVSIESVTKCYGNCDGCILTEQQRKDDEVNKGAPMQWATRWARKALAPVRRTSAADGAFLILGQGEHLEVDPVETVIDWIDAAMPHADGISEFSTALLMPNARVKDSIRRMYQRSIEVKQGMLPNIVFSPKKVIPEGFSTKYLENINTVVETFGACDLTLNVGPDVVDLMSPRQFHDMIVESGLKQVEINMIPTPSNAHLMVPRYRDMIAWLIGLGGEWLGDPSRFLIPYMVDIGAVARERHGADFEHAKTFLREHFLAELYVTLDGNVYLSGSGGAAVVMPFNHNLGFPPAQSGFAEYDLQKLLDYSEWLSKRLWVTHQRYKACRSCPHLTTCIAGGFTPALGMVAGAKGVNDDKCPTGAYDLIEFSFQYNLENHDALQKLWQQKVVQLNFASEEQKAAGMIDPGRHGDAKSFGDIVSVRSMRRHIDIPVVVEHTGKKQP